MFSSPTARLITAILMPSGCPSAAYRVGGTSRGISPSRQIPAYLYSYQFTVIRPSVFGFAPWILQLAITDVQTGRHDFSQQMKLKAGDIYVTEDTVHYLSPWRT